MKLNANGTKTVLSIAALLLFTIVILETIYIFQKDDVKNINTIRNKTTPKPLNAYSFENLKKTKFPASDITFGSVTDETDEYVQRLFYFSTPKIPNGNEMDKVSGLATIPKKEGRFPVIVMLRGFIPQETYFPGAGTTPLAKELALSEYITLAPDFLGFGESSSPSTDGFEGRFQTYTTALSLLSSLNSLNIGLNKEYESTVSANLEKVGLWGHSNGGHIALSTLAISGGNYPTVLWAPVSKSFPYSILYYTDETDDQGKSLRTALYDFEKLYNTQEFSPEKFYKWIKAPIQINQGTNDPEVPFWWSDELVDVLNKNESTNVTYNSYPGANHNLAPSWTEAVSNTIEHYNNNLKQPQE